MKSPQYIKWDVTPWDGMTMGCFIPVYPQPIWVSYGILIVNETYTGQNIIAFVVELEVTEMYGG